MTLLEHLIGKDGEDAPVPIIAMVLLSVLLVLSAVAGFLTLPGRLER
jgi:hypothetical protein